jgi:hypothetical protein
MRGASVQDARCKTEKVKDFVNWLRLRNSSRLRFKYSRKGRLTANV